MLALVGAFCCGMAWVSVFASLSAATQSSAPAWVRARAVAMNLVAVQASLAAGSAFWGAVASATDTRTALAASACALIIALMLNRQRRVHMGEEADVTPSLHMPELAIATEPLPDDGPVLIQIEYQIDPENRARSCARSTRSRPRAAATAPRAGASIATLAPRGASSSATSSRLGPNTCACARA